MKYRPAYSGTVRKKTCSGWWFDCGNAQVTNLKLYLIAGLVYMEGFLGAGFQE
jgi:hypothetical protein